MISTIDISNRNIFREFSNFFIYIVKTHAVKTLTITHHFSFLQGDPNFMLSSVKREDAGDYSCESVNDGGNISQPFRLVVNEIPRLKTRPSVEQDFEAGQPAVLACKAEGWPFPAIKWLKDGKPLKLPSSAAANAGRPTGASTAGEAIEIGRLLPNLHRYQI